MTSRTRRLATALFASVVLFGLSACGDDDTTGPGATYDLTFTGDASFQGAHGGQDIHVFVEDGSGGVVAGENGTVSSSADPAFSFTFEDALEEGESYELMYWIDSNFGGGTPDECDSPDVDHQWRISIGTVSDDVTIDDTHRPTETEQICSDSEDNPGEPGY